jgi:hypothetical protein
MKKAFDYQERADECRMLARAAKTAEHRGMLLKMADTWADLAHSRTVAEAAKERLATLEKVGDNE